MNNHFLYDVCIAFLQSHVKCYVDSGLCEMIWGNIGAMKSVMEFDDFFGADARLAREQVRSFSSVIMRLYPQFCVLTQLAIFTYNRIQH